jgi:membrane associated rhomboid family serine protease
VVPLPISDDNPTQNRVVAVKAIVILCAAIWLWEWATGIPDATLDYGLIPRWLLGHTRDGLLRLPTGAIIGLHQEVPWPLTAVTHMFLHGGWGHVIGNLWFLWIFGDNVEDRMGSLLFVVFYLLCGFAAAAAQIAVDPGSTIPMVGASGAIAGVMGGYLVLFPHARVRCFWWLFIFITFVRLPAWLMLAIWFGSQFLIPKGAGIAAMAHAGGFVAGLILVKLFARGP